MRDELFCTLKIVKAKDVSCRRRTCKKENRSEQFSVDYLYFETKAVSATERQQMFPMMIVWFTVAELNSDQKLIFFRKNALEYSSNFLKRFADIPE